MPFDWREYLRLARYIREQGDRSVEIDREAAYRCAVSRAYYAAFCYARNRACDRWGFAGERANVHKELAEFLRNVDGMAGIARALMRLRDWRNRCDYDDTIPRYLNIQFMAAFAISEAQRIVDALYQPVREVKDLMLDTRCQNPVSRIQYPASSMMLQELDIRNYALIDRLKIDFSPGLNILTGETGAGKSIIIGAMGLMLGERASTDVIRTGAESASVRGTFEVSDDSQANRIISEADLKDEEDSDVLLLFRELSKTGRSRCRINDRSATLSILREVGDYT